MAKYTIYNNIGSVLASGTPTYNGTYLKVHYLSFNELNSPTAIAWTIGSYVDYRGERYYLYDIPQVTKKARSGSVGDAFSYANVTFYGKMHEFELMPFLDIVLGDNGIHFSTQNLVSTFENVQGIANRLQANCDYYFGENTWSIVLASNIPSSIPYTEVRDFSLAGGTMLDALNLIYELWGDLGWTYEVVNGVYTVTIGGANTATSDNMTPVFKQGMGNGLITIQESQQNKDSFGTRLFAYGSDRNINFRYYNDDEDILNHESLAIYNLMIPKEYWGTTDNLYDAKKCFIDATSAITEYGVRPKIHYFDGSEDEEIYPTIEGMTIQDVIDALAVTGETQFTPSTSIYTDTSVRVDQPLSVSNPLDDGTKTAGSTEYYTQSVKLPSYAGAVAGTTIFLSSVSVKKDGNLVLNGDLVYNMLQSSFGSPSSLVLRVYINGSIEASYDFTESSSGAQWTLSLSDRTIAVTAGQSISLAMYLATEASSYRVSLYCRNLLTVSLKVDVETTFTMSCRQFGFNIADRQALGSEGLGTIWLNSGWCAGRSFVIKACDYVATTDSWTLTLVRAYDESVGMVYPNSTYTIETTDTFVLTDIAMPNSYIKVAEARLYEKAQELLAKISTRQSYYTPAVDPIVVDEDSITLKEGMYMQIQDTQITGGVTQVIQIDTVTITESETLPSYRITLREGKTTTFRNSIAEKSTNTSLTNVTPSSGSSSEGGTSDYTQLSNLPSINSVTLLGALSLSTLGIAGATELTAALAEAKSYSDGNLATAKSYTDTQIAAITDVYQTLLSKPRLLLTEMSTGKYLTLWHPGVAMSDVEYVLMVYRKKNGRKKGTASHQYKKGWTLAQGHKHPGDCFSIPFASSSATARFMAVGNILDYIVQHFCMADGYTEAQMYSMTYSQWVALAYTIECGFSSAWDASSPAYNKNIILGIAARWENPDWAGVLTSGATVDDTTTEIDGVRRYIYSEVAPLLTHAEGDISNHLHRGRIGFSIK